MKSLAKRVEDRYQTRRRDARRHRALPRRPAGARRRAAAATPVVTACGRPDRDRHHAGRPRGGQPAQPARLLIVLLAILLVALVAGGGVLLPRCSSAARRTSRSPTWSVTGDGGSGRDR